MGFLTDLFIYEWLFGGKKAKAKRDGDGNPICGECRTVVDEQATTCPGCSASLYTWRGRIGRRLIGLGSVIWLIVVAGAIIGAEHVIQFVFFPLLAIPGIIGVLMGWHWYKNRPVRELKFREALPVGGTDDGPNPQDS